MRHAQAMPGRATIPAGLRARLEAARLDLLALFRALDRMDLAPSEIPQRLIRQLFELDADFAEALWALDQPRGTLDDRLMLRDAGGSGTTPRSLQPIPEESPSPSSSRLGTARGYRSPEAATGRSLQHGSRP